MRQRRRSTSGRGLAGAAALFACVAIISAAMMTSTPSASAGASASVTTTVFGSSEAPGVQIFEIDGREYGVTTAINVLTFNMSQYRVRIALAHHAIDGGVQTPSSMCRSTPNCVAAVNGDYFDMTRPGQPDPGDEVGAITQNCVLLHTPEISHQQANLDGQILSQDFNWSDTVDVNGAVVPISAINQELPMSYSKVDLVLSGTLLYSAPYALKTPFAPGRVTYEFAIVGRSTSATRINATARLKLVAITRRALKLKKRQVAISAPRGSMLSTLRVGDTISTTTRSTGGCNNIGGHPILIDQGVAAPIAPADTYMTKPYARTVIGWTASGQTIILTVDGKDAVSGATGAQLVAILRSLNVVTALDLDGGDSTTLYAGGRIMNLPSLGFERPVSTGLLVVRNSRASS
ncbi:MAG: phosphodiester glycosidase family protein [Acidimicrobiaceae bacterium]|nr:phosphodiester glycosidase family protein [Acidimicrobiaceae bacterium]